MRSKVQQERRSDLDRSSPSPRQVGEAEQKIRRSRQCPGLRRIPASSPDGKTRNGTAAHRSRPEVSEFLAMKSSVVQEMPGSWSFLWRRREGNPNLQRASLIGMRWRSRTKEFHLGSVVENAVPDKPCCFCQNTARVIC